LIGSIPSVSCQERTFGAADPKGGAVEHGPRFFSQATCHHAPEVIGGIGEARAAALLKSFFAARR
jgi:tRNA(adenine34) deaminase